MLLLPGGDGPDRGWTSGRRRRRARVDEEAGGCPVRQNGGRRRAWLAGAGGMVLPGGSDLRRVAAASPEPGERAAPGAVMGEVGVGVVPGVLRALRDQALLDLGGHA